MAQTQIMTVKLIELYHTHGYHGRFAAAHTEYAVAHHIGARIYSYYYTFPLAQSLVAASSRGGLRRRRQVRHAPPPPSSW